MFYKKHAAFDAEYLRSILDYDPLTGVFHWRVRSDVPQKWNTRYAGMTAGSVRKNGYVIIQISKQMHYPAHVLAWLYVYGEWRPGQIDHRHGVRDDNRISELRVAMPTDNGANKTMQRNNRSGHIGVHFLKQCQKWEAAVAKKGRRVWRKRFNTIEEAVAARAIAVREIHGDFVPAVPVRKRYFHARDDS